MYLYRFPLLLSFAESRLFIVRVCSADKLNLSVSGDEDETFKKTGDYDVRSETGSSSDSDDDASSHNSGDSPSRGM